MQLTSVAAAVAAVAAAMAPTAGALWPHPASVHSGQSPVRVHAVGLAIHLPHGAPADLRNASHRIASEIQASSMLALVAGRGSAQAAQIHHAPELSELHVNFPNTSQSLLSELTRKPAEYDESYNLTVPADGTPATLDAHTALGALRGLTTFQQLIFALPDGSAKYISNAPFDIQDKPAFPYRGLLIDTGRNFYPVKDLERQLDTMSLIKLNQFHWHIADSQSFPLQLDGDYAVLSEKGASSPGLTYSRNDVAHLVAYAAERGININVEIDMPGHEYEGVKDFGKSNGDLLQCGGEADWWNWANEPPPGSLKLNSSAVNSYTAGLIKQVAKLFPSAYFGTGGDEVNLACYNATNASQIDASGIKPFLKNAHDAVSASGKTPMVWEEMAIGFPATGKSLRKGTIVETWTNATAAGLVLQANPDVQLIHAPSDFFYLDCGTSGAWLTGSLGNATYWCPFVSWSKMYEFDPYNGTHSVPGGPARVLGGEAALWSETVDGPSLDATIWPRAASAAEVFWTGASYSSNGSSVTRNVTLAMPRMHDIRFRMADRGVAARPLQPLYCALHPGQCNVVTAPAA